MFSIVYKFKVSNIIGALILGIFLEFGSSFATNSEFCKPLGVYEVTVEYIQSGYKQNYKQTFLMVQTDSSGEHVDLYHIFIDSSRSVGFEKSKSQNYYKRNIHEVIFLGKCQHIKTIQGIVKTDYIHSSQYLQPGNMKVTERNYPTYHKFICPLDLYFYGRSYLNGGLILGANTSFMPLIGNDGVKDMNGNIKRSISKVSWSDTFVQDFERLSEFIFKKSEIGKHLANYEEYSKALYMRDILSSNVKSNDDSTILFKNKYKTFGMKLLIDSSQHKMRDSIYSLFNLLCKRKGWMHPYQGETRRELSNLLLQGGADLYGGINIANGIGHLLSIMTSKDSSDILNVKNKLEHIETEINNSRQNLNDRKSIKNTYLYKLSKLNQQVNSIDASVFQLNEYNKFLLQFKNKKYLIDTNYSTEKNPEIDSVYLISPTENIVDIYQHENVLTSIKTKISNIVQDSSVNKYTYLPMANYNKTIFENLEKIKVKINFLKKYIYQTKTHFENTTLDSNQTEINKLVHIEDVLDKIKPIQNDILNSKKNSIAIILSLDSDLKEILHPFKSEANQFYREVEGSFIPGPIFNGTKNYFVSYILQQSGSSKFLNKYSVEKRPLLLMEGFRYSLTRSLIDSICNDIQFSNYIFDNHLLPSLDKDSVLKLISEFRKSVINNTLNPNIILSSPNYGILVKLNYEFSDLNIAIHSLVTELKRKRDTINKEIVDITNNNRDKLENDADQFIVSTDEYKSEINAAINKNENLFKISAEIIIENGLKNGKNYSMQDIDSIYSKVNNKNRLPSETVRLKELEYDRELSLNEIAQIYVRSIRAHMSSKEYRDRNNSDSVLYPENVISIIERKQNKYLGSNIKRMIYNCSKSPLLSYYNQYPEMLDDEYLGRNARITDSLLNAKEATIIDTKQIINNIKKSVISNRNHYVKKYPLNPILIAYDSIMLQENEELVQYLRSFYDAVADQRLISIVDYNTIETNIPNVNSTNVYDMLTDWQSSKGNSTLWNSSSSVLKNSLLEQYLYNTGVTQFVYEGRPNSTPIWKHISYDIKTQEWMLYTIMDRYWGQYGSSCDMCCARLGFKYDGNKIRITSLLVFSDCY
jgi:hypothetical protein